MGETIGRMWFFVFLNFFVFIFGCAGSLLLCVGFSVAAARGLLIAVARRL